MDEIFKMVETIRLAEASANFEKGRPHMSARFFRRWQAWAEAVKERHVKVPPVITRSLVALSAYTEEAFDQATFRLLEFSHDTRQPTAVTHWTFLRAAAGRRRHRRTSVAIICTSCAAPVESINRSACRYCIAAVAPLGPKWIVDDVRMEEAGSASAV